MWWRRPRTCDNIASSGLQYASFTCLATPAPCKTTHSRLPFVYDIVCAGTTTVWPLADVKPLPLALPFLDQRHDVPQPVKWAGRVLKAHQRRKLRAVLVKDDWSLDLGWEAGAA